MSVQYTWGRGGGAVQQGMFGMPGDIMSTVGGYHEYTERCHEYTKGIS